MTEDTSGLNYTLMFDEYREVDILAPDGGKELTIYATYGLALKNGNHVYVCKDEETGDFHCYSLVGGLVVKEVIKDEKQKKRLKFHIEAGQAEKKLRDCTIEQYEYDGAEYWEKVLAPQWVRDYEAGVAEGIRYMTDKEAESPFDTEPEGK